MVHILLLIIYLAFVSLGLPDGLLGAAWPAIHLEMDLGVVSATFKNIRAVLKSLDLLEVNQ